MNRFFSNSLILAVFCGGFFVLTAGVNWLSSGEPTGQAAELSLDRRRADDFWRQRKWSQAAVHFENLTKQDPYNGSAWFYLGDCYGNLRFDYIRAIYRELERKSQPDLAKVDQYRKQANALGDKAIPGFEHALDFPRYRNRARYNLARIYAFRNEHDTAIEYLAQAIDDDFVCGVRGGIKRVYEFRTLQDNQTFQQLCTAERNNFNRSKNGFYELRR